MTYPVGAAPGRLVAWSQGNRRHARARTAVLRRGFLRNFRSPGPRPAETRRRSAIAPPLSVADTWVAAAPASRNARTARPAREIGPEKRAGKRAGKRGGRLRPKRSGGGARAPADLLPRLRARARRNAARLAPASPFPEPPRPALQDNGPRAASRTEAHKKRQRNGPLAHSRERRRPVGATSRPARCIARGPADAAPQAGEIYFADTVNGLR